MRCGILVLCFATIILAATTKDTFIYPPAANTVPDDPDLLPKFTVGQTVQLRWSSSLDIVSIGLRTKGDNILLIGGGAQGDILQEQPNENGTAWKVKSIGSTESDNEYYIAGISNDESSYFTSNYFIIEPAAVVSSSSSTSMTSTSTSSTSFPSSTSSTSSVTTTTSQAPASQTPGGSAASAATPSFNPSPAAAPQGLSTGAKVAIGVVVPLAVLAILAAAFFLYRRGVRKGRMAATEAGSGMPQMYHSPMPAGQEYQKPSAYQSQAQGGGYYAPQKHYAAPPAELPSGNTYSEMSADHGRH